MAVRLVGSRVLSDSKLVRSLIFLGWKLIFLKLRSKVNSQLNMDFVLNGLEPPAEKAERAPSGFRIGPSRCTGCDS